MKKVNRKEQNRRIEREKKQRNRLVATIAVFTLVVILAGISWIIWDTQSRGWILRFEGERIPTNELRFFMGDDTPEGKQTALEDLLQSLAVIHRAEQRGLGLTDEERDVWASWAGEFGAGFVSPERFGEFMSASGFEIWERLMDFYVPVSLVAIDDAQLALDIAEYIEENRVDYTTMEVLHVLVDDREEAEEIHDRLIMGEITFEELVYERAPWLWIEEEERLMSVSHWDFMDEAMLGPEEVDTLLAMQAGEFSEIIPWGERMGTETQLLIYVVSREEPDEVEIERDFRERFVLTERNRMMMSLVPQWVEQAQYEKNQRAFDLV